MASANPPKESPHTEGLDEGLRHEIYKIVEFAYNRGYNTGDGFKQKGLTSDFLYARSVEILALIESTVLSVIGEDEQLVGDLENSVKALFDITDMPRLVRNTLRAEQRSKLGRLMGK